MQKYSDSILNKQGRPVAGATITVTTYPGNSAATIYAADGGPSVASVTTDSNGRFAFYALDGHYNLSITGNGIDAFTVTDVVLNDPNDDASQNTAVQLLAAVVDTVQETLVAVNAELTAQGDALQLADYAALRAYSGPRKSVYVTGVLGTAAPSGIAGMFVLDAADTTSADNGGTVIVANGRRFKRAVSGVVDVRWFGAKGDGVIDSTAAIQAALNSGLDVDLLDGTYKVTGNITRTGTTPQRLFGRGATLKVALGGSTDLFTLNSAVSIEGVTFDFGDGPCRYALNYAENIGHLWLRNVVFKNLKDTDSATGSILVRLPPTGNTFDFAGMRFNNIKKRGNGSITDAAGSLNLIYVGGGTGGTQGSIRDVEIKTVQNLNASDVVIYEDTSGIYIITDANDNTNRITIDGVYGYNFGKRLLKIHASNVTVTDVTGKSEEGDSLGVIGFLSGEGLGTKVGCSARSVRAYGKMEFAFSSSAAGTKWSDVISYTTPGTKTGMNTASFGLLINGDDTVVDGYESGSERLIGIGSSQQIIRNTKLQNLKFVINSAVLLGFQNLSSTLGFDGLTIDGAHVVHDATSTGIVAFGSELYLDGATKKGRNVELRNITIVSQGPTNSYGLNFKYCENISLEGYRYINSSANSHFRMAIFDTCANVNVDNVVIEGAHQIGVHLVTCTGRNTINRIQAAGATTAAVYNNNSSDVLVNACDTARVSGQTTATYQNSRMAVGTTAMRPATGRVAGFTMYFDTTLGKPVWWDGAAWKDATGATV